MVIKTEPPLDRAPPGPHGYDRHQDASTPPATVAGERLFVGLFTSVAYNARRATSRCCGARSTRVLERAGFAPGSHDGKALLHILETYPRDELFQIAEDELLDIALGILQLQERQRVALFVRRDPFERFVSCLVYVPRDRYSTELRQRFQAILERAPSTARVIGLLHADDGRRARAALQFIVRTTPGAIPRSTPPRSRRSSSRPARTWADHLQRRAGRGAAARSEGCALLRRYADAFPVAYRERFDAARRGGRHRARSRRRWPAEPPAP